MRTLSVGNRESRGMKREGRSLDLLPSNLELGFSLLEMLVVLVLLATVTAVAAPSIGRGIATVELNTTARQIAAILRSARSKAVREQQVFFVGFDLEKGRVDLTSEDLKYQKSFELPEKLKIKRVELRSGQSINEELFYWFSFAPNGLSESFEIMIENQRGRGLKVIQDFSARSPRIEEVEPEAGARG